MKAPTRSIALILSVLLLSVVYSGCTKKKNEQRDAVSSATGNKEYTVSEEGNHITSGEKLALPDWWFRWMPLTKDANIIYIQTNDNTGDKLLQFSTKQDIEKTFNSYHNSFRDEENYSELNSETDKSIFFNKDNNLVYILLMPSPDSKDCVVQISFAEGKSAMDMGNIDDVAGPEDFPGSLNGDFSNGSDNLYSDGGMGENSYPKDTDSSNQALGYDREANSYDGTGSDISSGASGGNASSFDDYATELSPDYPKDLVPLFGGAVVIYSYSDEYEGLKQFSVSLLTSAKFSEVKAFYEKQLTSIENRELQDNSDYVEITGVKNNFDIRLAITDGETETSIAIDLRERSTPQHAFDQIDAYDRPLEKPYNLIPVMPGAKITDAYEEVWDGGGDYTVSAVSMNTISQICDFYREKVKMKEKEVQNNGDEFRVDGKIEGYLIYIFGVTNFYGPNGEYQFINYSIQYTPES